MNKFLKTFWCVSFCLFGVFTLHAKFDEDVLSKFKLPSFEKAEILEGKGGDFKEVSEEYGNKTANLCVLYKKALAMGQNVVVPAFFAIGNKAVKDFLSKEFEFDDLWIDFKLKQKDRKILDSKAKDILKRFRELIGEAFDNNILQEIKNEIDYHLKLTKFGNKLLMVRSTGKEDSKGVANAGGNESVSSVEANVGAIWDAMKKVVISYFIGIPHFDRFNRILTLAYIVSKASGINFSKPPEIIFGRVVLLSIPWLLDKKSDLTNFVKSLYILALNTWVPMKIYHKTGTEISKTNSDIIIDINEIFPLGKGLNANMSVLELFNKSYYWKDLPSEFFSKATYFNLEIIKDLVKKKDYDMAFRFIDFTGEKFLKSDDTKYFKLIGILGDLLEMGDLLENRMVFDEVRKRFYTYLNLDYKLSKYPLSHLRILSLLAKFDDTSQEYIKKQIPTWIESNPSEVLVILIDIYVGNEKFVKDKLNYFMRDKNKFFSLLGKRLFRNNLVEFFVSLMPDKLSQLKDSLTSLYDKLPKKKKGEISDIIDRIAYSLIQNKIGFELVKDLSILLLGKKEYEKAGEIAVGLANKKQFGLAKEIAFALLDKNKYKFPGKITLKFAKNKQLSLVGKMITKFNEKIEQLKQQKEEDKVKRLEGRLERLQRKLKEIEEKKNAK
jgi:hypothetical protein